MKKKTVHKATIRFTPFHWQWLRRVARAKEEHISSLVRRHIVFWLVKNEEAQKPKRGWKV